MWNTYFLTIIIKNNINIIGGMVIVDEDNKIYLLKILIITINTNIIIKKLKYNQYFVLLL